MSDRIVCKICGGKVHAIQTHLKADHADWTLERYKAEFPGEPLLSDLALQKLAEREAQIGVVNTPVPSVTSELATRVPLHTAFGLPSHPSTQNGRGEPIQIEVLANNPETDDYIPAIDNNYVYETDNLKNALMALDLNVPLLLWGHTGTGKTTLIEQIAARTKRPAIRVQHTINTEEPEIVGQWVARGGETLFELGPLPYAMKHGLVYIADEYDFGLPSVLAVYQPVLEGKPLVIKGADAANRIIKPHQNFRFVATGNTNGSGDESGLYQGTLLQNAANYDRFNMVLKVVYMKPELEEQILVKQAHIVPDDARKLVDFANRVRESYEGQKVSTPISPRTLIRAAQIGFRKGSYRAGITLAFANKLSVIDKEVIEGLSQRVFGN